MPIWNQKIRPMFIKDGQPLKFRLMATVAFGMGIDIADVRFVIHHSMSKSIENYYQERGCAGRDDMKADCILHYGFGDIFRISSMVVMENVGQQKLYEMVSYCQNISKCRRVLIAQRFVEVWNSEACKRMCDNCFKDIETSYLKIGSTANLNSDGHLITMQVKKPIQSCFRIHSEGADKKREEKHPALTSPET
ncbi:ATP-dependent DNA helicase Q1-like isoform X1 [Eumetopias jubatus]|uniref:ATP-dependent DNA helicase Q1-like isoform X1 n=2 Tax=Eumetopias jubatus TaxID=34886 RepID=UPI001016E6B0|nr:ATP-dependent DNA helicase Q1-like isoform X1 [Eumetopias jubatus]XP_027949038.1 ATP-dependent DNA helicase Q1-like isoform X1 [Eumetopias jubatus]XP_027949039.1 ATP-dependent DNA helicase Q1-like isoform X1 [Eumetopias jubatus]XP_027949040.1 ATP-dependent DNA helicase Q1-like isoform X1 [Eumetopias jubatus]XP_027949041.1 ATP-dependent DNA helicase Q1-like isoform X1 [Eumetopias jubatus]XP_027949042.1 ATP-dependent DNA helicase Q1-like isoform X1 [Eumetopias jubatus]